MQFKLDMYEMMEILDPLNQNAYDKLQSELEKKICKTITEDEWLRIWEDGNWKIDMVITIKENEQ
jgi:uncharacterized protein YfbU (UPF0304 family)